MYLYAPLTDKTRKQTNAHSICHAPNSEIVAEQSFHKFNKIILFLKEKVKTHENYLIELDNSLGLK